MQYLKYMLALTCAFSFPVKAAPLSADYLVNVPQLKAPTAGTVLGSLAKFNTAAADLSQGALAPDSVDTVIFLNKFPGTHHAES